MVEPFKYDGVLNDYKATAVLKRCGKSALDFGCHTGELVSFLRANGIDAYGIDKESYEFKPFCSRRSLQGVGTRFDTVIAWNVLEHIEDDHKTLDHLLSVATKNVILCLPREDTISLDSGVTYRSYIDPTHKHCYTEQTLKAMIHQPFTVEYATRCRPVKVYQVPFSGLIDWLLFILSKDKRRFYADMVIEITV